MSAVKKFSLLFCVLFVALTFTPGAQAHSSLVDSSPKVGESLNKLPQEISLRFDEEIQDLKKKFKESKARISDGEKQANAALGHIQMAI